MGTMSSWRRFVNRYAQLGTAVLGMIIVFSSVIFFAERGRIAVAVITAGLFILLVGIWYANNPLLTNERRYVPLRAEVGQFINLVRALNRAARTKKEDDLERTKSAMHNSVERMAELADREGTEPLPP